MQTAQPQLDRDVFEKLEREHGDSFYIVDLDAFVANYHEFLAEFRALYVNSHIAYSYKTNYTPRLCEMVKEWGGYAEVVSRMEYDLARRVGVAPDRIVFNGPYKAQEDIEVALKSGAIVNVDWPYQISIVKELARRFASVKIGIRVTFAVPSSRPSRFGFDADGDELAIVIEHLRASQNVEIAGLHCHFLTPGRSVEDYAFITGRMLKLGQQLFGDAPLQFINLGGGYFSKMKKELEAQFAIRVPTYHDYAQAIATQFAANYRNGNGPQLILEPGISLTADVVKFAARVIDVRVLGSRKLALVSGSIYDIKPTLNSRNLPVEVVAGSGTPRIGGKIDIVGYTCMEHDVLFSGFEGELAVGDYVIFDNVGAYTNVLRPPFIRECPAIVGYRNGQFEVLKRRQNFDDVFGAYSFNGASVRADY